MSKLTEHLPPPNAASASQQCQGSSSSNPYSNKLRVTLLSSEWRSTKGGLSTINRELAIQLAKQPSVEVSVYVPHCSEEDKRVAATHNVHLIKAEKMAGFDDAYWLSSLPHNHAVDCVIGHGAVLGRHVQFIKRHRNCKWIQVVHTAPEELGMHKSYADAIPRGEKKHQAEVELCEKADQVVAVGPKLAEAFSSYLRGCGKDEDVLNFTPGIFSEFANVTQATEERKTFKVLVFGRGDNEDFELKGYDIAAKAIAELKDDPQPYQLLFVGAQVGEEEKVKNMLLHHGIDRSQLSVRCFNESREQLARLFCEVDLAIMPSRTEGFGLAALEALSAGLPVLVSGNSGLGEALKDVPYGASCVVESEHPKDWAYAIRGVRRKKRTLRLKESSVLREEYATMYKWQDHCDMLIETMGNISRGENLDVLTDCGTCEQDGASSTQNGKNLDVTVNCEGCEQEGASPTQNGNREENGVQKKYPSSQEIVNLIAEKYIQTIDLSNPEGLNGFLEYMEKVRQTIVIDVKKGSLIITVQCSSLHILDELWEDYCTGHLKEVAQRFLVTDDVLKELGVDAVQLTVTINEEEYRAYRKYLLGHEGLVKSFASISITDDIPTVSTLDAVKSEEQTSLFDDARPTATQAPGNRSPSSIPLSKEYTEEQLNYFRICYAFTDILAEGLRDIFKQEWDKQHKLTKGEWKDEPRNGMDFYNEESSRNKRRYAHLLATMQNGNRGEWDCTMLFYAILSSDCVGPSLSATVRENVDDLRKLRNLEFAHRPEGSLSDIDFQNVISKFDKAFQALGLPTVKIQDLTVQKQYATKELQNILKEVDDLKWEVQVRVQALEDELRIISPSFCILPTKPSHDIGDREHEVSQIARQLRELKESSDNKLSCLYISGNPGSGKSQLASLVAQRFFDEIREIPGSSSFVMTFNAATPDSLLESYASLARCLKCPDYSIMEILSSKDWNVEKKITNLKLLISGKISCYTSWLLVVDNVTNMSSVYCHLPQCENESWARGQLLITTQNAGFIPLKSSFVDHVSVSNGMNPDDACSLLVKLSGVQESELLTKVAQELDYQPLALAGAAVFVKEMRQDEASRNFGWNEYLKILKKDKSETTEDTLAYTIPVYPKSMTKAIMLAVATVMRSDELVKHLFTFLSLCAPRRLTVEIVISYIIDVLKQCDEAGKELIHMRLRRCPLLLFEGGQGGYFVRVHQVVYDAIKTVINNTPEGQTPEVVNAVITSFDTFINVVPPENRRLETMHIVPHLKALTKVTGKVFMKENLFQVHSKDISDKCENLAQICEMHSELNVAKTFWQYSLTIKLEKLGPEHVDVTRNYNKLAILYMALGDLEQAKEYQERALAIQLKTFGVAPVPVATSYSNFASIYKDLGDLEKAKEYQQLALAIVVDKLGPKHVDVARGYNNLALIYKSLGDLEQAKEYQLRALDITLDKLGPEHVDVATSYNNLASIYKSLGDLEQAKEYQLRALGITLDKLGPEHVDVATSFNNLASIYKDLGDLEQAKNYQQHALAIQSKVLDPEHASVTSSYSNLASIHLALGDLVQAKEYQQRALDIEIQKVGQKDVSVATSFNNLASIYLALGDLEQAKEYQQYALAIQLEKLGPEHVSVASSYSNLSLVYLDLGDLQQAKECQERALVITLDKLGPEHVDVATSFNNLASIYKSLGDLEQAKEYQLRALYITLDKLGPEHVDVATSYNNLASIYKAVGDPEQAMEYQQRALAIQLEKLGPHHVSVASSYSNVASICMALGDNKQAIEYQQRALEIQLNMLGPKHASVASSYSNLGSVYLDLGDLEQAKEFQQRALSIRLHQLGPKHVSVATSYSNLASISMALGDNQQAKEYQERALAIQLEKLGPEHASVASSFNNLASISKALRDLEQAKEYQRHALAILLKKVGQKEIGP